MLDRFPVDLTTLDHLVDLAGRLADIVAKVGFPMVVAGWLLFRHEQLERDNLTVLTEIRAILAGWLGEGGEHGKN